MSEELSLEERIFEDPDLALLALKDHYKGSLYYTCKDLLGYKDITRFTHGPMIECLESSATRKLICVPRGCFKSSIGVVGYTIWRLMNDPNLRILIDSEVYVNSKNFIREIKAHLQSPKFVAIFGDWRSNDNWNEGEITVNCRTKVLKEATVVASGVAAIKVSQHFDVILNDDLNSGNNSLTQEARKKVIQHYQMNQAILEPNGCYVVIGTRYAADDLIGWILENEVLQKEETSG